MVVFHAQNHELPEFYAGNYIITSMNIPIGFRITSSEI